VRAFYQAVKVKFLDSFPFSSGSVFWLFLLVHPSGSGSPKPGTGCRSRCSLSLGQARGILLLFKDW